MRAALLLCCAAGALASGPEADHAARRDSLLSTGLLLANGSAADLAPGLLPFEEDSLRPAAIDAVLRGARLDHWADSLARDWQECDRLSKAAELLRAPGPAESLSLPAFELPGRGGTKGRRQWIALLQDLSGVRFLPDTTVVQLEEDLRSLYEEDEEEAEADLFTLDRRYREGLLERDQRLERLRDPARRAGRRAESLLPRLDLLIEHREQLAAAFRGSRLQEDGDCGPLYYRDEFLLIGGEGPNVYRDPLPPVVIDLGGDDLLLASAAVTRGGFSCYIDLSGDDTYRCAEGPALAIGGLALLADLDGDDRYLAGDFSLACALGGTAILLDHAGEDLYRGGMLSQAAAVLGSALLSEGGGRDSYDCQLYGQAFAGPGAVAVLNDLEGDDLYAARPRVTDFIRYDDHSLSLSQGFAYGLRPELPGGVALLADAGGNDLYTCDIYGQGAAYWWALGALVDRSGNDVYNSWQYAQGSGVHLAAGMLLDDAGNDRYISNGVSQGCGHDLAIGWLADGAGDDSYLSGGLSMGAGNANGIGLLGDAGGADVYTLRDAANSMGYGNSRRRSGSLGLFVDGGGEDRHPGAVVADSLWRGSRRGAGIDAELFPLPAYTEEDKPKDTPPPLDALFDSTGAVEDLYLFAVWGTRVRHRWQEERRIAHRVLRERQQEFLPWLEPRLSGAESWERHGIRECLNTFGEESWPWFRAALDSADRKSRGLLLWTLSYMSDIGSDSTFAAYYRRIPAEEAGNRSQCLINGARRGPAMQPALLAALDEDSPRVRAAASWGLGQGEPDSLSREALVRALGDPVLAVRLSARQGLAADSSLGADWLLETLAGEETGGPRFREILRLLAERDPEAAELLLDQLPQTPGLQLEGRLQGGSAEGE